MFADSIQQSPRWGLGSRRVKATEAEAVEAAYTVGTAGGVGRMDRGRGGFIEERHVQRIERERKVEGEGSAGGSDRGLRGNNRVARRPSAAGCPWRLIASLQRRMTSRDATALDRSSPGRAS